MASPAFRASQVVTGTLVAAAVLGACGGNSSSLGPKKAEAARTASRICASANAGVKRGFEASPDPQVREGVISQANVRYRIESSTLDEMRGLSEPETGLRQWRAFIAAQEKAVKATKALVGHGTEGAVSLGLSRAKAAEDAMLAAGDGTKVAAARLGARACEAGPYQQNLQGVPVGAQPPELGAGTARADRKLGGYTFRFRYPANWRAKQVSDTGKGEVALSYGSDDSFCIVGHEATTIYSGPATPGPKLLAYLKGQVAESRKEANSYRLYRIGVARPKDRYLQGGLIVRRSVTGSDVRNGRIAFLFTPHSARKGRDRYTVDCETSDSKRFDLIDRIAFQPLLDSLSVAPPKPG